MALSRRVSGVLGCLAVVCSVLVVTTAPASAAPNRKVSLSVSARSVVVGTKVTLSGKVSKTPKSSKISIDRLAGKKWKTFKIVKTTSTKGAFKASFRATGVGRTTYRARAMKTKKLREARSASRTVTVIRLQSSSAPTAPVPEDRPAVATLQASRSDAAAGENVMFTGSVAPATAGTAVMLERSVAGAWQRDGTPGVVRADGGFSFDRVMVAGAWSYRAVVARSTSGISAATTNVVDVRVEGPASLQVQVLSAPPGSTPEVTIVDPDGATSVIHETTTFARATIGRWTVTGAPIPVGPDGDSAWPAVPAQAAAVQAGQSATVVVDYTAVLPATTAVIPADSSIAAEATDDPDVKLVTLTPSAATNARVSAARTDRRTRLARTSAATFGFCPVRNGQYLATGVSTAYPRGAIGRASDVNCLPSGIQSFYLHTGTGIRFDQLVSSGQIDGSTALMRITGDDVIETAQGIGKIIDGAEITKRAQSGTVKPVKTAPAGKPLDCDNGGTMTVGADVDVTPEITLDPRWSGLSLTSATARASVKQTGRLYVTASGKCTKSFRTNLATVHFAPLVTSAGPVPIVITPELRLVASGQVTADAKGTVEVTQHASASGAVTWDKATGFGELKTSNDVVAPTPSADLNGKVHANATLRAELFFKINAVGGPTAFAEGALDFDGEASVGTGGASLRYGLVPSFRAGAEFKIDVLGLTVASDPYIFYDHTFDPILHGDFATHDPPEITTDSLPPGTAGVPYDQRLQTADNRQGAWSRSSGTLPTGLQLSGDRIVGTPTAAGPSTFSITFTDAYRRATTHTYSITVVPAGGQLEPGTVLKVSRAADGGDADGASDGPSLSGDGRYVAYSSSASNIVSDDNNGFPDIFLWDTVTSTTVKVSHATNGSAANEASTMPAISADGRHVTFASVASNIAGTGNNGFNQIYAWDRLTDETIQVSQVGGRSSFNGAGNAVISADGRYISYSAFDPLYDIGDASHESEVFLWDRQTRNTIKVSRASDGSNSNGSSYLPDISADGRYVTYQSAASNLVSNDTNGMSDVFVWDRHTGATAKASVAGNGDGANAGSSGATISADGRYISYLSSASNLVGGDTNGKSDVFVLDRQSGGTLKVSQASNGGPTNDSSANAAISGDGRYVAYATMSTNIVPEDNGDPNLLYDVFVWDRQTGATSKVSRPTGSGFAQGDSYGPAFSGDGNRVAYASTAPDLVMSDTNGRSDIFVWNR